MSQVDVSRELESAPYADPKPCLVSMGGENRRISTWDLNAIRNSYLIGILNEDGVRTYFKLGEICNGKGEFAYYADMDNWEQGRADVFRYVRQGVRSTEKTEVRARPDFAEAIP